MDEADLVPLNRNIRRFPQAVKNHLKKVYRTVCFALLAYALGAYVHMVWNVGGLLSNLVHIGSIFWLYSNASSKRLYIMFLSAFLNGVSVGPTIELAIDHDSSILITAIVATTLVFASFSTVAMLANRREYLHIGRGLSLSTKILNLMQCIPSAVFQADVSTFKRNFEFFCGLFRYVGDIMVDTQTIVEREHRGDRDYVEHAFTFFTNFVDVFCRLIISLKANTKRSRKEDTETTN